MCGHSSSRVHDRGRFCDDWGSTMGLTRKDAEKNQAHISSAVGRAHLLGITIDWEIDHATRLVENGLEVLAQASSANPGIPKDDRQ